MKKLKSLTMIQQGSVIVYVENTKQAYTALELLSMPDVTKLDSGKSSLPELIQYLLEVKVVAFLEKVCAFLSPLIPSAGEDILDTLRASVESSLGGLRDKNAVIDFSPEHGPQMGWCQSLLLEMKFYFVKMKHRNLMVGIKFKSFLVSP